MGYVVFLAFLILFVLKWLVKTTHAAGVRSAGVKRRRASRRSNWNAQKRPQAAGQPAPTYRKPSSAVGVGAVIRGQAWVTDGDTIRVGYQQVRLFGIDAPELDHPYGVKAKWALHRLCKGHQVIAKITDIDHYGRLVAHCSLSDGTDLSAEMVKLGLAIDWPKYSGGKYRTLEVYDARRRLFLADARQKGRMHVWREFEERQRSQ